MQTSFEGALFDVDGVLVDSPHEQAWRQSLRELMENQWSGIRADTTWSPEAFTSRVYQQQVSGKPRRSGALSALAYFHVPDAPRRADEYADQKQAMIVQLIDAGDFHAFPDALRYLLAVKNAGLRIVAASSSKNANRMMSKIRLDTFAVEQGIDSPAVRPGLTLLDVFDGNVSGRDFRRGKPDPQMFLAAAAEIGVAPRAAVVMEDATAGILAAKAGQMAGIGVARGDDADALAAAGADLVVTSLDQVDVNGLAAGSVRARPG